MISLKNKILLWAGVFILLSALNGCSSLGGAPPRPPLPPPKPEPRVEKPRSFLYFYRVEKLPFSLEAVPIFINDRLVARLKNNSYTWISVPMGKYIIRLEYGVRAPTSESSEDSSGSFYESEKASITVEKGHSYFFRAKEVFVHKKEYGLLPIIKFSFDPVPQNDALIEITGAQYFEPEEPQFGDGDGLNVCRGPVRCD